MFAVDRFPSRIQPWLLNAIVEVVRRKGDVYIFPKGGGDASYPSKVDEFGLLARTTRTPFGHAHGLGEALFRLVQPGSRGQAHRDGAVALSKSEVRWLTGGARGFANRLIKLPAMGLRGVDLVHSHGMVSAFEYLEVARVLEVPLVHTFHGLTPKGVRTLGPAKMRRLFEGITLSMVNTDFARGQLTGLGFPEARVRVVPQGLDLEAFPFVPTSRAPDTPLRVLTVGRLHVDKGHRYAIEAMDVLRRQHVPVSYTIVGGGPEKRRLELLVRELGLDGCVQLTGMLDDEGLRRELQLADVFLLPSIDMGDGGHVETQGVVIQEAQASGKIVVASNTGGIPECVDDGRSAFLVEQQDAEAIADRLGQLYSMPDQWAEWQREGRAWVERKYELGVIGGRVQAVYEEAMSLRSSRRTHG